MRFADFFQVYKADVMPRLKLNTWRTKEYVIRDKILPFFGEMRLSDIAPADVLAWQTKLMGHVDPKTGKHYKKAYLRTVNNTLSSILNHAVRYYGLPVSPMAKTGKIGSSKPDEMQFWTKGEYQRFAEEIMDKPASFAIFELLYWCGIREGEALALTPSDFDFPAKLLKITRATSASRAKTSSPRPRQRNPCARWRCRTSWPRSLRTTSAWRASIPTSAYSGSQSPTSTTRWTAGARPRTSKRIRVHDLRHSHVSLLIEMGFSIVAIADRVGHESTGHHLQVRAPVPEHPIRHGSEAEPRKE